MWRELIQGEIDRRGQGAASVAEAAGLSRQRLHQILKRDHEPRLREVVALADALGLTGEQRAALLGSSAWGAE